MKTFVLVMTVIGVLNTLCYAWNISHGVQLPEWTRHFDAAAYAVLAVWGAFLLGAQS